jgi:hypothetical protein
MVTPACYTFTPCRSGDHEFCSASYQHGGDAHASFCDCDCHRTITFSTAKEQTDGERAYLLTCLQASRELPAEDRSAIVNQALRQLCPEPRLA